MAKQIKNTEVSQNLLIISKSLSAAGRTGPVLQQADIQCVPQLLMTLKFCRNAQVTRALTGRRSVRPAADDDFEIC